MDKFCANCGNKLAAEETFCGQCGAKVEAPVAEAAPVVEVAGDAAVAKKASFDINAIIDKAMAFVGDFIEKAKAKPVLFAIPAGIVVGIIVLIILMSALFGGGAEEKAIKNLLDVQYKGKTNKIESLAPKAYWDWLEDEQDMTVEDIIEEYEDNDTYEEMMEYLEEEYGDNVKISYKITEKEKLSKKKLEKIADGLKENYDIAKKSVKAAYEIEVEMTVKGSEDKDDDDAKFYVAKIDGKWYPVTANGDFLVG
ncbi:MAG: zinc ribbon domain-containing protein [Clostridia bacterium]|nr:zinc ribbon domain-containing protein [Clostridia bacterium]